VVAVRLPARRAKFSTSDWQRQFISVEELDEPIPADQAIMPGMRHLAARVFPHGLQEANRLAARFGGRGGRPPSVMQYPPGLGETVAMWL
jgi:hypothetical protein